MSNTMKLLITRCVDWRFSMVQNMFLLLTWATHREGCFMSVSLYFASRDSYKRQQAKQDTGHTTCRYHSYTRIT